MADKEHLRQRYADLLGPEPEPDLLGIVARLDEAAAPYHGLEPPRAVDQAIERLVAQRRPATPINRLPAEPPRPDAHSLLHTRRPAGDPPIPTRHRWTHHAMGAAAVLALVLLAGVLATVFQSQGGQGRIGAGVQATPQTPAAPATPKTSGINGGLTVDQAQGLVDFRLLAPGWVPSYLVDHGLHVVGQPQFPATSGTPASEPEQPGQGHGIFWTFGPRASSQRYGVQIQEHASSASDQPPGLGLGTPAPMTIVNQVVSRAQLPSPNVKTVLYQWTTQGTYVQIIAQIAGPLREPDVLQLIASMIQQAPGGPSADVDGRYLGITFAQAEQLAPFHLAQPSWLPSYLSHGGLAANAVPKFDSSTGKVSGYGPVNDVSFSYGPADPSQPYFVQFEERPGSVHQSFPGNPTPTPLTIAGHRVTRTAFTAAGATTMTNYYWEDQGTAFIVLAQISGPLIKQDVEHMIGSMLPSG